MKSFLLVLLFFVIIPRGSKGDYQTWVTDPRYSMFPNIPIVAPDSEDELCRTHSQLFLQELKNKTQWAMQLWDATAKTPSGVLSGQVFQFGNFDECLKIVAPFKVQYCLGHFFVHVAPKFYEFQESGKATMSSSTWSHIANSRVNPARIPRDLIGWGLCLPMSCKLEELEETMNAHLESFSLEFYNETTFWIHLDENFCTQKTQTIEIYPAEISFWIVLFTLILLTASSTIMDLIQPEKESKPSKIYKIWMLFSVKKNYPHVVPMGPRKKSYLDVFHGIKFVSILFVLYGHRIGISLTLSALNYDEVETFYIQEHKMFFFQTDLVVDTFFFISGLLACYIMMDISKKQFVNPLAASAVRIFRVAPMYFFVIWYQSTAAFRLGSGPLWNGLAKNETDFCVENWWTNILFINNYVNVEQMCMPHSWFLPCEVHFFIMASILVPILARYEKFGRILLGIVTLGFIITPGVLIYINEIKPLILFYFGFLAQPRLDETFNSMYIRSHNRAGVYLIGMAIGLFLHYKKESKTRISMKLTLLGVLGWFAFLFAPMAYGSLYYDLSRPFNPLESAIFGSLRRISWGVGFSIFTLVHRFGTVPLVDKIFATKPALFLSRLTYGIYLVHFLFVTSDILMNRTTQYFSVHDLIIIGFGDIMKSAFVTLVLMFILEIPLKRFFREHVVAKKVEELERPPEVQNVFTVRL